MRGLHLPARATAAQATAPDRRAGDLPRPSGMQRALLALTVALPALLAVPMEGCIIPENIQQESDAGPVIVAAPQFEQFSPAVAIDCLDDTTVGSLDSLYSNFYVIVQDAAGVSNTPLIARWFVNYSVDDQASQNYVIQDPPRSPVLGTVAYGLISHTALDLGLPSMPYGVYAIEVVVADSFDDSQLPLNRTPPPEHYATSYKWVVKYLQGEASCPP